MEAQWYTSVAGIIAGTLILVEVLKRALGNVALVKAVPTWVYAVVVAVGLTYASRAAGLLTDQGSTLDVLMTAVMLAASASGFWTWLRNPADKIEDSAPAHNQRYTRGLPIVLLAVTLAAGCGKNLAPELVAADDAVHDALAAAQDGIDEICRPQLLVETCREVNGVLVVALQAGRDFNRAIASERLATLGPLVESAGRVLTAVQKFPASDIRAKVIADLQRFIESAFKGVRQ